MPYCASLFPAGGGTSTEEPSVECEDDDCDESSECGDDCDESPECGEDCEESPECGDDCDESPECGEDCEESPECGDDCEESPECDDCDEGSPEEQSPEEGESADELIEQELRESTSAEEAPLQDDAQQSMEEALQQMSDESAGGAMIGGDGQVEVDTEALANMINALFE